MYVYVVCVYASGMLVCVCMKGSSVCGVGFACGVSVMGLCLSGMGVRCAHVYVTLCACFIPLCVCNVLCLHLGSVCGV